MLLAAHRQQQLRLFAILKDTNREFVTSDYVRLEVIPKATFHGNAAEVDFYNEFFRSALRTVPTSTTLLSWAMEEAIRYGLNAIDAIHIACAVFREAEELITSEVSTKPIHRSKAIKVVSIHPRTP